MEKNKGIVVVAIIMVMLSSGLSFGVYDQAFAQVPPDVSPSPGTDITTLISGDNPITTSFTHSGNVAVTTSTVAFPHTITPAGNFNIVLPAGSTVIQALMYTNSWTDGTATGTLNAVNLGLGTPISSDSAGAFNHFTFRWDATAVIPGTGVYPFSITLGGGGTLAVYATLVVVYSNPTNPNQQVIINDGAEILQNAGSTTVFNGVGAGAGTLDILIGSGDTAGTGSEEIRYNGATLAGPDNIFNCNIGCFADVFSFAVPTTSGANTADIITGNDFIVWPLAILTAPSAIVIGGEMIPIDTTALLLASVQSISAWMIPVVVAGIGIAIGVFVIKRRK